MLVFLGRFEKVFDAWLVIALRARHCHVWSMRCGLPSRRRATPLRPLSSSLLSPPPHIHTQFRYVLPCAVCSRESAQAPVSGAVAALRESALQRLLSDMVVSPRSEVRGGEVAEVWKGVEGRG